jgi:4-amino-4-deoxy-L-arabinose transferase-like glycosyltransferase
VPFAIFGPTVTSLRLAPALYSVVFLFVSERFARRAFGTTAATATSLYLALGPLFLLTWSVKARGGYAELIALGEILLWLGLLIGQSKTPRPWTWLAFGGVAGLALWTDPLAVVYLVPAAFYLLLRLRTRIWNLGLVLSVAGFLIMAWPMLLSNVRSRGETLRELMSPNVSQPLNLATLQHNASRVVQEGVPILLGFLQASSNLAAFAAAKAASPWPASATTAVSLALVLAIVVLALTSVPRAIRARPEPRDLLAWVGVCTIALFCTSQVEALYVTEPRYLLPLYSLVPLVGASWARLWSGHRAAGLAAALAILALNVGSVLAFAPALAAPRLDGMVVDAGDPGLAAFLDTHHVRAIYADYWLVYPIVFQSQERVAASVIDERLHVGFNRYIPTAIAVDHDPSPGVLVVSGSATEQRLRAFLDTSGRSYRVERWSNLDLFDGIAPPFRPVH